MVTGANSGVGFEVAKFLAGNIYPQTLSMCVSIDFHFDYERVTERRV